MKKNYFFLCALFFALTLTTNAQLSGNFNVPGNYPSIAAAVNDLNLQGVNGPVNILISTGYTELAPAGGYTLTATGTSLNPITFQKSGTGANPLIYAYSGGTATPASTTQDGIWRFIGSDYITIDGINLVDTNSFNPATMEFGYGFFKASATDGCQNNFIKNCTITLNRINNASGNTTSVDGSRGVEFVNALTSTHTTSVVVTSASGSNSNNRIYSNLIQNCNIGIAMIGYASSTPFTNSDWNNDIGGNSGTTGNTIINYGGGGTLTPAAAIRTLAQYSINISHNVINNNNGSGVSHGNTLRGIYLNTAMSANASITNNTVTIIFGGTTQLYSAIENASGSTPANNTITISNNLITNCSAQNVTSGDFYGIYNTASSQNLVVANNTFTNNATAPTTGVTYLIRSSGAITGSITAENNILSHAFNGTVATTGALYNIYVSGTGTASSVSYKNNSFISYPSTFTNTGTYYFIYNAKDGNNLLIKDNLWNNLTLNHSGTEYFMYNTGSTYSVLTVANNTITGITRNGATGAFYGYYSVTSTPGTAAHTFSANIISNINSTVPGTGLFYGIYNSEGGSSPYPRKSVFDNVISNVNSDGSGTGYAFYLADVGDGGGTAGSQVYNNLVQNINRSGTLYGIYISTPTSPNFPLAVFNNTVSGLTTSGATVGGTYLSATGAGVTFYKNKISDVTSTSSTGITYGLYTTGSNTATIHNNLIGNLFAPSASGANRVNGIYVNTGTVVNVYYNSVYVNAASSATDFATNAIYSSTVTNLTLKNNIFVNLSTPSGTGTAVAYRRSNTSLANYNTASNNNLFYAGTPSASNLIFSDGTNNYQTLANYMSVVNPADANSVTDNPTFQSLVGTNANFLNINTSIQTPIESGGNPVAGITSDYIGTVRNASTPDIGAWEGNYTPLANDVAAPAFLNDGFTSMACGLSGRTYTINLTDASGVASGTVAPRVYYNINGNPYTSVAGNLTSGTATNGVWTFNLTYAASIGDVVSYFVVAQDIAGTPNLNALPGVGFAGTSVNNVTSFPTTPYTYTISTTLGGSYNVGTAGTYTTLTDAVNAYNTSCLTSSVTFVLTDPSYSANETFPVIVMNNVYASSTNSLLIVPATGNNATVVTSNPVSSTLRLLDSRYITIDGNNIGGSSLTVANTHTATSATIWIASSAGGPGNKNIEIRNLNVTGSGTVATRYGILAGQTSANPVTTSGTDNDFVSILNNTITNVYYGIYANGTATTVAGGIDNWIISSNTIGASVPGTGNVGLRAIHVSNAPGIVITNNLLQNIIGTGAVSGIYLSSGISGATVSQNTITNVTSSTASSGTSAINGIFMGSNVINAVVTRNVINGVHNSNTSGYAGRGINVVVANTNSNNKINNNMISGISGTGDNTAAYWPVGIALEGSSGNVSVEFNSISLNSSIAGISTATASAAIYLNTTGSNNSLRNNILANTYDNTTITNDVAYAVYSSAASGSNLSVMDHNNYYSGGTGNVAVLGYVNSTPLLNLASIQGAFGGNLNSLNIAPVFISSSDLHLVPAQNAMIDGFGTPVTGITLDIDGQTRSLTNPDMGADEFTAPSCTTAAGGVLSSSSFSLCNGDALSITSTSASAGANTVYQWMQSSTAGGPYSPVSGGNGANTISYVSPNLNIGTIYYVLQVSCTTLSLTSISNEATVSVNPIPTASITSNAPVCQGSALNLNGSSDIATNYNWNGPAGFSSSVQNPVISNVPALGAGIYTLVTSAANCSSPSATIAVTINTLNVSINGPFTICSGNSATLNAVTSGTSLVWSTLATSSSIVVSPVTNTVYDVTATSAAGCTLSVSHTVTVGSPTISGAGMFACGTPSAIGTLTANAFGPVNWYDTPTSTVVIGSGNTFVTPAVTTNTTFYAESTIFSQPADLTTPVSGSSAFMGVMFDLVAQNMIEVNSFDMQLSTTGPCTIEVWHRPGSFVGFETSNVGWTLAQTTTLTSLGVGQLSPIPGNLGLVIGQGQTHAFYIVSTGGGPLPRYTNNASFPLGSVWTQNSDLQILAGKSGQNYFAVTTSPRQVNCNVNYTLPGCTSPRIPVTLSVTAQPTVNISASSTTICAGSAVVLTASGASSYSWSNGATTAVIAENPSVSITYTVTGDNGGCVDAETLSVTVNQLPTVSLTAPQMTTCVNAPSIALTGSPSGGTYSGSNVSGSTFVPGSTAGAFTSQYSYVDATTGCSNSASLAIVVDPCTGLNNAEQLSGVSVYPNPNLGIFTITLRNGQGKKIEMTDLTGRMIFSTTTNNDETEVDITDFAKGVYFVKIESEGKNEIYKIVKQ